MIFIAAWSAIVLFFPLVHAFPTTKSAPLTNEPSSLLGRHYVVHNESPVMPFVRNEEMIRDGPLGRADRFQIAAQRKAAHQNSAEVIEGRVEHDVDLLSKQGPPPAVPAPVADANPTQTHLAVPNTSITLIPRPSSTSHVKHRKGSGKTASAKSRSRKERSSGRDRQS